MELTEENKERFKRIYSRLRPEYYECDICGERITHHSQILPLELRHISSLTDEEFSELSNIRGGKCNRWRDSYYDDKLEELFIDDNRIRWISVNALMDMRDFLRSIGVFCGFMGIPEKDLLEAGWFKYKIICFN